MVTALDEMWHPECFTCVNCDTILKAYNYVVQDNKQYCKPCHEKLFGPPCSACHKPTKNVSSLHLIEWITNFYRKYRIDWLYWTGFGTRTASVVLNVERYCNLITLSNVWALPIVRKTITGSSLLSVASAPNPSKMYVFGSKQLPNEWMIFVSIEL